MPANRITPPWTTWVSALWLALWLALPAAAEQLNLKDDPQGFGGLAWGTPLDQTQGLWLAGKDLSLGGLDIYHSEAPRQEFEGVALKKALYVFWRDRFLAVDLEVEGPEAFAALKKACLDKFGPGFQPQRYLERHYWVGPQTQASLEYQEVRQRARLRLHSRELMRQAEEAAKGRRR